MKSTYFFVFTALLLIHSCVKTLPDEELTMIQTAYYGKEIRMDGYYSGVSYQSGNTKYIQYMFFYSNGILYTSGGYNCDIKDINTITVLMDKDRNDKRQWAVFQIKEPFVIMQGWILKSDVYQHIVIDYQYKIVNDTTLFYKNSWGDTTRFYFKKYFSKPDSTNVFIK